MKLKHILPVACLSLLLTQCSSQGYENIFEHSKFQGGDVLVEVNGVKIHQSFIDYLGEINPRLKQQLSNERARKRILESLVEQQLLQAEAIQRGLQNSEEVQFKNLLNQQILVVNQLIEDQMNKELKTTYEARKDSDFTKVDVSLIGVYFDDKEGRKIKEPTEKQKAAALKEINKAKELLKTKKFDEVAKDISDDRMTNRKGGKAGQVSKGDKRFARMGLNKLTEKAFELKKGDVSDPIETGHGYYILQVNSDPVVTPFDEAQRVLRFELQNKVKSKLLADLKKDATITYAEGTKETIDPAKILKEKMKGSHKHDKEDGHGHGHNHGDPKKEK